MQSFFFLEEFICRLSNVLWLDLERDAKWRKRNGGSFFRAEASGSRSQTEASPSRRPEITPSVREIRSPIVYIEIRSWRNARRSKKVFEKDKRGQKRPQAKAALTQVLSSLELGRQREVERKKQKLGKREQHLFWIFSSASSNG